MTIIKRIKTDNKYVLAETKINTLDDFIVYYNSEKSSDDFLSFPEHVNNLIKENIDNSVVVSYKKIIRTVSGLIASPRFKNHIKYWTCRGYSLEESKLKVFFIQKNAADKFNYKRSNNPELYDDIMPSQIKYWIKKGFSEEEAKYKVKEHQSTFSLEKCITRHGKEKGIEIFNDRQKKWLNSIIKSEGSTWMHSDKSLSNDNYKKRYNQDWIDVKIQHLKNRKSNVKIIEQLEEIKKYVNDKDGLVQFLMDCDFKKMSELLSNTVVQDLIELDNHIRFKSKWCEINNVTKIENGSIYGNSYYYNGKFYKSDGEFIIGKFLEDNNILFSNNTIYPGTNKYCDFYIQSIDLYVEYMGMEEQSYKDKIKLLSKTPYKIIWSNNTEHIINTIYEKIHKYN